MAVLVRIWTAVLCAVGLQLSAQAQSVAPGDILQPVDRETVHPVWQAFEPEFTPYVCPFHEAAPKYDPEEFVCGYVLVPEDRTDPRSRLIKLSVLKITSTSEAPEAGAIVRLTGGPGGPSLGAGRIRAYQAPDTRAFREAADLIFFDQRGIGYSEAAFCRAVPRIFQFGVPSMPDGMPLWQEAFRKCIAEARLQGIAVDAYSTWQNALDVRDIRIALGYDQWTLFGVSYGTELGQAVLEVDEAGTRAAILDSVVPAGPWGPGGWEAPVYGFRTALMALSEACAENTRCARDVGDMSARFIAAFESYDADPLIIEDQDPGTYLGGRVVLDGTLAASAVFQALYINDLYPDFPSLLKALETRNTDAIAAYAETLGRRIDHIYGNGMELVANCRGSSRVTPEERAASEQAEPQLSKWMSTLSWLEICSDVYTAATDPVVKVLDTDVPILIGAGLADPITPPVFGRELADRLPNAQIAEFPHTGHGVFLSHFDGCGQDLLLAFAKDPMAPLDTSCASAIPAPAFQTRLIHTAAPYRFALGLQAGQYPIGLIVAAFTLLVGVIALPAGWVARRMEGRSTPTLALGRPLMWGGALASLIGLGVAVHMILKTATQHPMALPIGVLPATGLGFWFGLLGFALMVAALVRAWRSGGLSWRHPGILVAVVALPVASAFVLGRLASLGLGPF
ncbi:MAG: alpha/beta fold hydrolase [Henriciella sp.]|nr:alpha/beta fold hydrolase [Henriciella sp.]